MLRSVRERQAHRAADGSGTALAITAHALLNELEAE